jgi:hypothetical protein
MYRLLLLLLLTTCSSIECAEWSTATNNGICHREENDMGFGTEERVWCEVKAANGKTSYSLNPVLTGDNVCTVYEGRY